MGFRHRHALGENDTAAAEHNWTMSSSAAGHSVFSVRRSHQERRGPVVTSWNVTDREPTRHVLSM